MPLLLLIGQLDQRTVAASFGLDLPHQSAGGGSDAHFTGALGIPSLHGPGAPGEGLHTLTEHIEVPSSPNAGV
ncbi:MAG: hypothetical protein ACREFZ_02995 [Acetobacteraceae bacterium]